MELPDVGSMLGGVARIGARDQCRAMRSSALTGRWQSVSNQAEATRHPPAPARPAAMVPRAINAGSGRPRGPPHACRISRVRGPSVPLSSWVAGLQLVAFQLPPAPWQGTRWPMPTVRCNSGYSTSLEPEAMSFAIHTWAFTDVPSAQQRNLWAVAPRSAGAVSKNRSPEACHLTTHRSHNARRDTSRSTCHSSHRPRRDLPRPPRRLSARPNDRSSYRPPSGLR